MLDELSQNWNEFKTSINKEITRKRIREQREDYDEEEKQEDEEEENKSQSSRKSDEEKDHKPTASSYRIFYITKIKRKR